ncbi:aspartyl/asparaginyl beta-hydroxylase domain-containing protein [Lysobacter claricitrinus]|uniref:aspartyl/asparaginyl beta-hydroxylase domain-containing protein n=1 Tax=Lysobacter claricitrinus TaxID=3367728 RepID=UPI0037DAA4AE
MKLPAPFLQLPLRFDAAALAREIDALGEDAWRPHPQGFAGNSMLPLVAVGGDPANEAFAGAMAATPALQRCPRLVRVLHAIGATVGRTRLMRLAGQAEVKRHVDQGYYWAERVRVHVPIVTQPTVRFECGDATINMAAGECWIFDTWRQHRVFNDATASRIHLVCDTVGGERFAALVDRARRHDEPREAWPVADVPLDGVVPPVLPFETRNVPDVMTPWELRHHLEFLLGEALPHPQLDALRQRTERLLQAWQGLWAQHGDAMPARPAFRALFDGYITDVRPWAADVALRNETRWIDGVAMMLGRSTVRVPGGGRPMPAMA